MHWPFNRKTTIEAEADERLQLSAAIEIQAASGDAGPATFKAKAYGGGIMAVGGFGDVLISLDGMEIPATFPILADHENRLAAVAGHGRGAVENGELMASGEIVRNSAAGGTIIDLSRSGVPLQASVGAKPLEVRFISAGQKVFANGRTFTASARGFKFVTKSKLRELTVCALGADEGTTVDVAAKDGAKSMNGTEDTKTIDLATLKRIDAAIDSLRGVGVSDEQLTTLRASAVDGELDVADIYEKGVATIKRANKLRDIEAGMEYPGLAGSSDDGSGPAIHSKSGLPDSGLKAVEAALLIRAGHEKLAVEEYGERVVDSLRGLQRASFCDILATGMRMLGHHAPHDRHDMIRAAVSQHGLTTALSNVGNLSIIGPYREARRTFPTFAARKSANDFKEHVGIRVTHDFDLRELPPGGEIEHALIGESTYPYRIKTFARMFGVDRHDIINDSVKAFDEVGPQMGRSAARMESNEFYRVLLSATSAYFDASLGNLGDEVFSVPALGRAITAIRKQRAGEEDLDIAPTVLLVAPELEIEAKAALESEYLENILGSTQMPTGNPVQKSLKLEVEPRLSNEAKYGENASPDQWFVFGAPVDAAMIYAYLRGRDTPIVDFFGFDHDPKTLAATWRTYHDFGAALAEHRAAYKSTGEST